MKPISELVELMTNARYLSSIELWIFTIELRHSIDLTVYKPIKLSLIRSMGYTKINI